MLYKYGLKHRGVSIGTQPTGFIKYEDVNKYETGFYSFIYYDRELTADELNKYEIMFIEQIKEQ